MQNYELIDISIPITSKTACFPGDTPFAKETTLSISEKGNFNLTRLTMSPHVGTHADAPVHIEGLLQNSEHTAGQLPLSDYIGEAAVIDISSCNGEITLAAVKDKLDSLKVFPERILFKTAVKLRYEVFEKEYAYFSPALIDFLAERKVRLIGIDTPSVDHIESKPLPVHHSLIKAKMSWLENLDLTEVKEGNYFLIAPPLKFMELEASPVRAVLLKNVGVN